MDVTTSCEFRIGTAIGIPAKVVTEDIFAVIIYLMGFTLAYVFPADVVNPLSGASPTLRNVYSIFMGKPEIVCSITPAFESISSLTFVTSLNIAKSESMTLIGKFGIKPIFALPVSKILSPLLRTLLPFKTVEKNPVGIAFVFIFL